MAECKASKEQSVPGMDSSQCREKNHRIRGGKRRKAVEWKGSLIAASLLLLIGLTAASGRLLTQPEDLGRQSLHELAVSYIMSKEGETTKVVGLI